MRTLPLVFLAVAPYALGQETRELTPPQLRGIRVWNQGPTGVIPVPKSRQVKFLFHAQFKNETPRELADLSVRMVVELGGRRAYVSPPQKLRRFANLSVPVTGALQPFNKTEFVEGIGFNVSSQLWRTDTHRYLEVVGASEYVKPDLHDAGHLFTRLMNGKDEEEIEMLKRDPSLLKVRNSQGFDITLMAFATCGPKMIRYVIAHGGSANTKTARGATIMHMAALNGYPGVCDLALKLGGNVNAKSKNGKTPLLKAIVHGSPVTWRWLLKHGANPNYEAGPGYTAAQYAIQEGQPMALADLVKAGVNPRTKDSTGQGWMHYAVFNPMLMDAVRGFGVPVDDPNPKDGKTPLMMAVWSGWLEPQVWLLKHGASPNWKDKKGRTAYDYAGTFTFDRAMARYKAMGHQPTARERADLAKARKRSKDYFAGLVKANSTK